MNNQLYTIGKMYLSLGISVVPINQYKIPNGVVLPKIEFNGKERPTWTPYQTRRATEEELMAWVSHPTTKGLAAVCGHVSGGLRAYDFEDVDIFREWVKRIGGREKLKGFLVTKTNKGYHLLHRMIDPGRSHVLAWHLKKGEPVPFIECIAEKKPVTLPPSIHPSGWIYTFMPGFDDITNIGFIHADKQMEWDEACRAFNQVERMKVVPEREQIQELSKVKIIISEYNKRNSVYPYLEQYGYHQMKSNAFHRPGGEKQSVYVYESDEGCEVTRHFNPSDVVCGVEMYGKPHDAFDWMRICSMENDFKKALRHAAEVCGIEWNDYESKQEEDFYQLLKQEGKTVLLTDDDAFARSIHERDHIPVLVGPKNKTWSRSILSMIEGFQYRVVLFSDGDSGRRTAEELDAVFVGIRNPFEFYQTNGIQGIVSLTKKAQGIV